MGGDMPKCHPHVTMLTEVRGEMSTCYIQGNSYYLAYITPTPTPKIYNIILCKQNYCDFFSVKNVVKNIL